MRYRASLSPPHQRLPACCGQLRLWRRKAPAGVRAPLAFPQLAMAVVVHGASALVVGAGLIGAEKRPN
jgi:hypothetical protein